MFSIWSASLLEKRLEFHQALADSSDSMLSKGRQCQHKTSQKFYAGAAMAGVGMKNLPAAGSPWTGYCH